MEAAEAYAAGLYADEPVSFSTEEDRCCTMNDFCAGWRNADRCSQWIPVEERLPEFVYPVEAEVKNTSEYVLAYNGYTMYISRLVGGKIHWWEDNSELVPTHWMPLPEAPKKGSEQCVK